MKVFSEKKNNFPIEFQIIFSRRKTIQIRVLPDEKVIVRSPYKVPYQAIQQFISKRINWIKKHQAYFRLHQKKIIPPQYIDNEEFFFRGQTYCLKITSAEKASVTLGENYFLYIKYPTPHTPQITEKLLLKWLRLQAQIEFQKSLERCFPPFQKMGYSCPILKIRKMKNRLGSLSSRGIITLNLNLIKISSEGLDYVTTHELCHLKHPHHQADFYVLLEQIMPDWKERKKNIII